jgi:GTPase
MIGAVQSTLADIGAGERPQLLALNKVDLLEPERRRELRFRHSDTTQVSAATGEGLDDLRAAIEARFLSAMRPMELLVPYGEGGRLAELHELAGEIEREDTPDGTKVRARVPEGAAPRFERFAVAGARGGDGEQVSRGPGPEADGAAPE